jgi:signal transduction histidine kinase
MLPMHLAEFIDSNMGAILAEWDEFAAAQLPAANEMSLLALRDHGEQILSAIARDLRQHQSAREQDLKSKGLAGKGLFARETAAQTHAFVRAGDGFNINQLAAEYRALRSSVVRLWAADDKLGGAEIEDMIRFNEAIDQALAESIAVFSQRVGEARDLTLGMFGHDLRNPLVAICMSANVLKRQSLPAEALKVIGVIASACRQMSGLLEDLVDFNRVRLGLGLQIERVELDLRQLCEEEINLIRAAYPDRRIELLASPACIGQFDGKRLQQLLGNLLVNALTHGAVESPVQIKLHVAAEHVALEVSNTGPTIQADDLQRIFEPLKKLGDPGSGRDPTGSLGLGLYISQQIVVAHGGNIAVVSQGGATVFSVSLPR